jgi:hypothetical protein
MMDGPTDAVESFLAESCALLGECVGRIDHCLGQLSDQQVWWRPHESTNSVGNLVLHLCGNLDQRVGSAVGGGTDRRDRPREFSERDPIPVGELARRLRDAAARADAVLGVLTPARLADLRRDPSRGTEVTVLTVLYRTLVHLGGHAQEIVFMTRSLLGDAYRFQRP